mgnify:CR=1 FL=1
MLEWYLSWLSKLRKRASSRCSRARFAAFQGRNADVRVDYVDSSFVDDSPDELATLGEILRRESGAARGSGAARATTADASSLEAPRFACVNRWVLDR